MCTMVSNDQQGNLPEGPRGIGERGQLATAMPDKNLPMHLCQTADPSDLGEIIHPQEYCCYLSVQPKVGIEATPS